MPRTRIVGRWTRLGIRKQLTTVAVLLVALPLCIGILLLANLLTSSLSNAQVTQAGRWPTARPRMPGNAAPRP